MLCGTFRFHKCNILFQYFPLDSEGTHEFQHFVKDLFGFAQLSASDGFSRNFRASIDDLV